MRKFFVVFFSILVVLMVMADPAQAQAIRTWVSGVGDDANPCSRTAPCKTFAGAISKTAAAGEISVLDPGSYGTVTITKSITLSGDGTLASITATGLNGITVNAGAEDVVIIRNLSIFGGNTGLNGIRYLAGKHLHVENCTIYGFKSASGRGISVQHGGIGLGNMTVRNTSIVNNAQVGIRILKTGAPAPTVVLENVEITHVLIGLDVLSGITTVNNSLVSQITNQGIVAEGAGTVINVNDSTVSNSGTGVSAFNAGSTIRLNNSSLLDNTTGISIAAGGTVASFGNNTNTTTGAPNAVLIQQ